MTTRRLSILFGTALTVALGAAALTACDEQAEPPPQDDQALETDAAEQLEPLSDIEIERALKREIAYDHSIPSAYFAVEVNAGVAELKGRVDTLLAKKRAEAIAKSVRGVRAVSNRLRVHTADRSDAALSADVQSALALDATSESYELTVGVEEGVVRLTGIVDSWAERAHAERVAMSVNGVRAVENELSIRNVGVDYDRKRSDRELARDVQSRLRWDTLVDDALIVVTVEDKEVALRGQVGSARERDRAISDAWVIGAEDVDAGELEIDPNLARSTLRGSKYVAKTDDEIYAAIVDAALYDPRLASYRVEPKVADGDVVLTGKVVNQRAKQAAEQLARATVGVQGVDNQIEVAPHDPVSDEEIARRIREVLRLNSRTDGYEIDVRVRGGVVTVRGEVDSFAEKAEVEDVAASVAGVVELKNEVDVVIETYPFVYDPFLFHYHPYVASTDVFIPTTSQFQDAQIARALQRELYWDPFLVSHEIDIRVVGGEARLSGTVDSYIERRNAEGLAYRVGATSVDNDLVVDPTEH